MTRRPDDDSDDEEAVERPRRRRRAGGLRVPSDNVPRHSGSQPVVAPVPTDPGLAVSIAYAFGDDASAPRPRIDDESGEESTAIGARPETPGGGFPSLDDIVPDGRTRQMPAVSLEALGLTAEDDPGAITHVGPPASPAPDAIPEAVDVMLDDDDLPGAMMTAPVPRQSIEVVGGTVSERPGSEPGADGAARITGKMEALTDEDLVELMDAGAGPVAAPHVPRRHPSTLPVRPPTAPQLEAVTPVGERSTVPMAAVAATEAMPSVIVSFSPSAAPAIPAGPPPVPFAPPASTAPATAPTLAPAPATVPATAIPPQPTMVGPAPMPPHASQPAVHPAAQASVPQVQPVASHTSGPTAVPLEPPGPEDSLSDGWTMPLGEHTGEAEAIGLATVEAVIDEVVDSVPAASDASDSGEILAEELVDDEEHARAAAVATLAPAPVPPPVPSVPSVPPVPPGALTSQPNLAAVPSQAAPPPPPAAVRPPPAPAVVRPPAPPSARQPQPSLDVDGEAKKKRRGRPWFEDVFDEDYLRTLPYLTPAATQAEARMVLEALELSAGASVLDLGCGYGRHAMELAARGLHVVGVDLSLPLLLRGNDEAQRRGLDINFVHADMRDIEFDAQFDGAYCLFSTFGYFDDDTNKKVATLIGKALKPGGRLVLQVLNRDYVIGDLPTRVWWEGDGCVVLEEVDFNYFSSRIQSKRSVVFDDARQVEQEISIRAYSLHELGKLLHAAGLRVVEVSGSMVTRGRFLGNRAREIIVIADRPK